MEKVDNKKMSSEESRSYMYFSPCIDAIFSKSNLNLRAQIQTVKNIGFKYFEFWSWWDKDIDLIERMVKQEEIQLSALCTRFISLVDRNEHLDYQQDLKLTIEVAKRLGVQTIITQTGNEMDLPRNQQLQNLKDGLISCIPLLEEADITLVVEPLNLLVDHPGYFLSSSDEAAELIATLNDSHIKMLFDVYHQQITEGNVTRRLMQYLPYIGHIHVADNPGRREPGTGELNYHYIFASLKHAGYQGGIGLEFFPDQSPEEKLKNFKKTFPL
jgi:hydroxypyruvate isomerase